MRSRRGPTFDARLRRRAARRAELIVPVPFHSRSLRARARPCSYSRLRRIAEVHDDQLPAALALEPDLASVIAGVNDVIRPRFDLDAALAHMDHMQRKLRDRGATVLTATFPDLSQLWPAARFVRTRFARF